MTVSRPSRTGQPTHSARIGAAVVVGLALLAGSPAHADKRIVSIRTDAKDVSIASVASAGQTLPEVGRSSDGVFVEVGKDDTPFACKQRLAIGLSNGAALDRSFDLCALNHAVTVKVAEAKSVETTAAQPAPARSTKAKPPERKLVMITTDDDAPIREVLIDGTAMEVRRRSKARVFVEVAGDPDNDGQIRCRRRVRLVLADGRILEEPVDICGDWKVTVKASATVRGANQAGDTARTVRPAVPSTASPSAPPLAGGIRRPETGSGSKDALRGSTDTAPARQTPAAADKTTTASTAPAPESTAPPRDEDGTVSGNAPPTDFGPVIEGRSWNVAREGGELRLYYGLATTHDRTLVASCQPGAGEMTFRSAETRSELTEGAPVDVTLSANDITRSYTGKGSPRAETGLSYPLVNLSAEDPIWSGLIRGQTLNVAFDGTWRFGLSLKGSARHVRQFQSACARPAPVVASPPPVGGDRPVGGASGPSCSDEGFITSIPSDRPSTLVFANTRRRPVVVHWINFDGNRETQARIPPGGEMVQRTLAGHPWLVSTTDGRCIGIYLAGDRSRTVTLRPGRVAPVPDPIYREPEPLLPPANIAPAPDLLDIGYDCDSGAYLTVTIDNDRRLATVHEAGRSPVTLAERGSGPGFYYAGRGYALSGEGNQAVWQRPGAPPQYCRVF